MKKLILSVIVAVSAVVLNAAAGDKAEDLAIVVNKASSLNDVSTADLTKFFKVEKSKAPDGSKLVVVMQDSGRPEREAALKGIFKMNDGELSRYYLQATFTGAITAAPKSVPNGASVVKFVTDTAGGIGYVKGDEATDAVKVVKVDGKSPGEDGYALKMK